MNAYELFEEVKRELIIWDLRSVAEAAGVTYQTLWNWTNDKITLPHLGTLTAVASVLGWEITWSRTEPRLQEAA